MLIFMFLFSCTKEERKKKKKNLLFADLPESPDVRGLQVSFTLSACQSHPQQVAFLAFCSENFNSCFGQVGQHGGPGSRPLTKLGSASSTRFSNIIMMISSFAIIMISSFASNFILLSQVSAQERASADETALLTSVFLAAGSTTTLKINTNK